LVGGRRLANRVGGGSKTIRVRRIQVHPSHHTRAPAILKQLFFFFCPCVGIAGRGVQPNTSHLEDVAKTASNSELRGILQARARSRIRSRCDSFLQSILNGRRGSVLRDYYLAVAPHMALVAFHRRTELSSLMVEISKEDDPFPAIRVRRPQESRILVVYPKLTSANGSSRRTGRRTAKVVLASEPGCGRRAMRRRRM